MNTSLKIMSVQGIFFLIGVIISLNSQVVRAQSTEVSPPTNFTASTAKGYVINVSWGAPANVETSPIDHYVLYLNGQALYQVTQTSYTERGSTLPGIQYCYSIATVDSTNKYSDQTPPACVTFPVGTTPTPTNVTATISGSHTVDLTWKFPITAQQLPPDNTKRLFRFSIERSTGESSEWSWLKSFNAWVSADNIPEQVTVTDTTVADGVKYRYRITAYDYGGSSALSDGTLGMGFSAASNIATGETPVVALVPNAPTDLSVQFTTVTMATLSFKDTSDTETGLIVERQMSDVWSTFLTLDQSINPSTSDYVVPITLNMNTSYTFRVRVTNSVGSSDPSNTITVVIPGSLSWSEPVASRDILIVYNSNDSRSVEVKNYYVQHRPLISSANMLAVNFDRPGTDANGFDVIAINKDVFQSNVLTPIRDFISSHSSIRYIVLMWGMPSQVYKYPYGSNGYEPGSVDYQISRVMQTAGLRYGAEYRKGVSTHFTPEYYQGTTALVSHIDMGSVVDTKKYIDKLETVYNQMDNKNIVLSGRNAGIGGGTYYIEERAQHVPESISALRNVNGGANIVSKDFNTGWITTASNVLGYATGGFWSGMGNRWALDGKIVFSGNSNWYIMRTGESFNGLRNNISSAQSSFTQWFLPSAFGGKNYEYTPVGAVVHVNEPGIPSNGAEYFSFWEKGYPFIEAAWGSRETAGGGIWMTVIGDPLVANTGPTKLVIADTVAPVISSPFPALGSILAAATTSVTLSIKTNENATCRYSPTAGVTYDNMSARPFTTTGAQSHSVILTGLKDGTSNTLYIRCRDVALNVNTSDYQVYFSIAQTVAIDDTTAPQVVITNPTPGAALPAGVILISATASDIVGVAGVKLYVDDQLLGSEDTVSPYSRNATLGIGTHTVYAVARDDAGNSAPSATVTFTTRQNDLPPPPPVPDELTIPDAEVVLPDYYSPLILPPTRTRGQTEGSGQQPSATAFLPVKLERNLKQGDTGTDVLLLQRTLNLLGYEIAAEGPESIGQETSQFDELTMQALIRYQENYSESGVAPTGVLDNATRTLLNGDIARLVLRAQDEFVATSTTTADRSGSSLSKIASYIGRGVDEVLHLIAGLFTWVLR